MAIALVQSTSTVGSGTSLSLAFTSSNTSGNLLIAFCLGIVSSGTLTCADTKNGSYSTAAPFSNPPAEVSIFYLPNCAGGANTVTLTAAGGASDLEIHIAEFSGIATSSPFDAQTSAQGSSAAPNSGSITTAANGELVVGYCLSGTASAAAGSGWTGISNQNGDQTQYQIKATAGSIAATFTQTSGPWVALVAAFKAASGGTAYTQNLTDSFTLAESFTFSLSRKFSESFSLADSIKKAPAKALADSFSLAESIVRSTGKKLAESFSLAENIAKSTARTLADAFSLSEAFAAARIKVLALVDSFSLSDSISKLAKKSISDTVTLSESLAKLTIKAPFIETFTLADVFSAIKTKILALSDAFTLSDSIAKLTSKRFSETFSISETLAAVRLKFLQLVDSITLVDRGLGKLTAKAFTETFTVSESIARSISKTFVDAFTLADSIVKSLIGAADAVRLYFAQILARLFGAQPAIRLWAAESKTRAWSATEEMITTDPKDPESVEDFEIDWSAFIGADSITDSAWEVPDGLTNVESSNTASTATIRLSGGVAGQTYLVKNKVTLNSGQVRPQTLLIPVR